MIARLLGNDVVVNENDCNLSCEYCLTGRSNLKPLHRERLIFGPPRLDVYREGTPLKERLDLMIQRFSERFSAPLIKLTGGEIFLIEGIEDLISACVARFERVLIQTNALLVQDDVLARIAALDRVVWQVSLDCHEHEGNRYRIAQPALHHKAMARLGAILDTGQPVEIYAVLNDRSTPRLHAFARWLCEDGRGATLWPFPVRGPDAERYSPRPEQLASLERVIEDYSDLVAALPPRAYLERLLGFLRAGGRSGRCHLPRLVASTFGDGTITACPNIWFSEIGSVLDPEWPAGAERMGDSGLYRTLLAQQPRLEACKRCFTPWDTLTLYFEDVISLDELCQSPVYSAPSLREFIERSKREWLAQEDRGVAR